MTSPATAIVPVTVAVPAVLSAVSGFGAAIMEFIEKLRDDALAERINANLSEAEAARCNAFRASVLTWVAPLHTQIRTARGMYKRIQDHPRLPHARLVLPDLQRISLEDNTRALGDLIAEWDEISTLISKASSTSFGRWMVENKWSVVLGLTGIILLVVPGCQWGIPQWMEAAAATGGAFLAVAGSALMRSHNKKSEEHHRYVKEQLESLLKLLVEFQAQSKADQALHASTTAVVSDAEVQVFIDVAPSMVQACEKLIEQLMSIQVGAHSLRQYSGSDQRWWWQRLLGVGAKEPIP